MKDTPEIIIELASNQIFVFGSNENGNHLGGAAKFAKERFGAIEGQSRGLMGQSYGITTLDKNMEKVKLGSIVIQIWNLFQYAMQNPNLEFLVTKIGCGIAGFPEKDIKNIVEFCKNIFGQPKNLILPKGW